MTCDLQKDATRASLAFRVQSPADENPTFVVLAEYGQFFDANSFRLTFNGRRERRVCGFYAGARVYSAPNALDDGLLHHVALDIEPGRAMTAKWERPKTTRRYLHGPFAERILTFWREGKIAFGEDEHTPDWDELSPDGWRREGDAVFNGDRFAAIGGATTWPPRRWTSASSTR